MKLKVFLGGVIVFVHFLYRLLVCWIMVLCVHLLFRLFMYRCVQYIFWIVSLFEYSFIRLLFSLFIFYLVCSFIVSFFHFILFFYLIFRLLFCLLFRIFIFYNIFSCIILLLYFLFSASTVHYVNIAHFFSPGKNTLLALIEEISLWPTAISLASPRHTLQKLSWTTIPIFF